MTSSNTNLGLKVQDISPLVDTIRKSNFAMDTMPLIPAAALDEDFEDDGTPEYLMNNVDKTQSAAFLRSKSSIKDKLGDRSEFGGLAYTNS